MCVADRWFSILDISSCIRNITRTGQRDFEQFNKGIKKAEGTSPVA
jgi:hypothetical protein